MYNTYILIVILLIGATAHTVAGDSNTKPQDNKEQKILLRKLQNFQQPKDETKPLTWNVMLADVLVNKIKIFSFNNAKGEITNTEPQENILTKVTSQILLIYKEIYDRFWTRRGTIQDVPKIDDVESEIDKEPDVAVRSVKGDSPKEQIELIEPRYHGKQECANCNDTEDVTEQAEKKSPDCGEGLVRDANGACVYSKYILAIPLQCPDGYRRDKLGYCRVVM